MGDFVTQDACKRTREAIYKDLTKMDCQIEELMDMKEAIARLTILQEQLSSQLSSGETQKFINSDTGKWLIKGLFIVFALIVLVALDQNIGMLDKLTGVK